MLRNGGAAHQPIAVFDRVFLHDSVSIWHCSLEHELVELVNDLQLASAAPLFVIAESLTLVWQLDGVPYRQALGPAELVSIPAGAVVTITAPRGTRFTIISVDAAELAGIGLGSVAYESVEVQNSTLSETLYYSMQSFRSATRRSVVAEYAQARIVIELITGIYFEQQVRTAQATNSLDQGFDAALAYIRQQRTDQNFDVARLARALGLSSRSLHRIFARRGTTPLAEIRRQRCVLAAALLDDDSHALTLEQVAQASGFSSAKALNRAFASIGIERPRRSVHPAVERERPNEQPADLRQ